MHVCHGHLAGQTGPFSAPQVEQEHEARREQRQLHTSLSTEPNRDWQREGHIAYSIENQGLPVLLELSLHDVCRGARRVRADRQRRERQAVGLAGRDERAVYAYLQPVVVRVQRA